MVGFSNKATAIETRIAQGGPPGPLQVLIKRGNRKVGLNVRYNSANMKRRRLALVAAIIVLICASALGYGLKKRKDQQVEEQKREEKRKAFYGSALSSYSKDLEPGITRNHVENYLETKAIPYLKSADADLVKIGQEAAPWFCSEVNVYVAFDFEAIEAHNRPWEPYGTDVLKRIHIYSRADGCL